MPSSSRRASAFAGLLTLCLVSSLLVVGPASGSIQPVHPWLENAPELVTAVAENPDKIPVEFNERLDYEMADGTMRVMVALSQRDAAVESFVADNTTWIQWYGDAPRFLARVTQAQMTALIDADVVTFVEPDYPITNFMSTSTLDVHARSLAGDGTGVWSYAPGPNGGALTSDVPGLSVDQATGKGVTVAITDSGIDKTHRDFGGWNCAAGPLQPCESRIRAAITIDHIVGAGAEPGPVMPTTEAASGHGTHVAGTIAGNAYYSRFRATPDTATYAPDGHNFGIAPQASLISTKNGDSQSAGFSSFGLQWQLDNAEQLDIRVSSNSWGCLGGCSFNGNSATAQLLKDMYEAGIVVVFAAGNDGTGSNGLSNAQSPYALGVANYDDGNHRLASSSSRGTDNTLPNASTWTPESEPINGEPRPDVGAPGTGIWSARTLTGGTSAGAGRVNIGDIATGSSGGTREYVQMTGTSMATPHVAGAAALLYGACPTATPLDVMRAVMVGADPTEILKTSGTQTAVPSEVGYGSLEIRRSVDWLLNQTACGGTGGGTDPSPTPTPTETVTPTPTQTTEPAVFTRYYFHSATGSGNVDQTQGLATFDDKAPTFTDPAYTTDIPVLGNTAPEGAGDPTWTGTVTGPINQLKLDFWAKVPEEEAQTGGVSWNVAVWDGDTEVRMPLFESESADLVDPHNVKHTFTTMLDEGGNEVPLSIDAAGPVTVQIKPWFSVNGAGGHILYDAVDFPSGFAVAAGAPAPEPTETVTPEPTETSGGGTAACSSYPATPNDPYFPDSADLLAPQQWGPQRILAPQAWQQPQATGCDVNVAVVDSGVDFQHEDLQCPGKLQAVSGADIAGDGDGADDVNGHGTHVAGIIGACTNNETGIAGVAPDSTILPIQALDVDGSGTVEGIADGIRRATDAGAHVINMSLSLGIGVPGSGAVGWIPGFVPEIDEAVEYANSNGVVVVAAAGNESLPLCEYPAIAEDVVCVGATDNRDLKSWYSGFPNKPDNEDTIGPALVAPGGAEPVFCDVASESVFSLWPEELDACDEGATGYRNANGTSMATPHVAGVAALVWDRIGSQRTPENRAAVVEALIGTAKDLGTPGYDPVFGYGRVDALAAVQSVEAAVDPVAATTLSFTDGSAAGVQHSDEALVQAVLTNTATGEPVAGQDVVFELTGSSGTRSWTFTTGPEGVAGEPVLFTEAPGSYTIAARFEGSSTHVASADLLNFVIEKDDSATALEILGDRNNRQLRATTTDLDSGVGLSGVTLTFFAEDGVELGSATTNENGVAILDVQKKYTKKETRYEAVFEGSDNYSGSSDRQPV